MKSIYKFAMVLALMLTVVGCSRVDPGHVGVRVSNWGERGVIPELVQPGKLVWNGPGYQLYQFPTFKQNYVYKDAEQLSFGTIEGLNVTANVGISYRIQPALATKVFQDYQKGVAEITQVDLRNTLQNALVNAAGKRKIETVYGASKAELIAEVKQVVAASMEKSGIQILDVYWSGNLGLPKDVTTSINAKIQATQMAEQRQNEVAQAEAEAAKAVAEAKGVADSQLLRARAEAEAIQIKGDALRDNPSLIELEKVNAMKILYSSCKGNGCQPVPTTIIGADANMLYQLK